MLRYIRLVFIKPMLNLFRSVFFFGKYFLYKRSYEDLFDFNYSFLHNHWILYGKFEGRSLFGATDILYFLKLTFIRREVLLGNNFLLGPDFKKISILLGIRKHNFITNNEFILVDKFYLRDFILNYVSEEYVDKVFRELPEKESLRFFFLFLISLERQMVNKNVRVRPLSRTNLDLIKIFNSLLKRVPTPSEIRDFIHTDVTVLSRYIISCLLWDISRQLGARFFQFPSLLNGGQLISQTKIHKIDSRIIKSIKFTPGLTTEIPRVTLITSVYNGEKYLSDFLLNIENVYSYFPNFELILVDANSEDSSVEIINNFIQKSTIPMRLIELSSRVTIYYAWNLAIQNAKGEYISNANLDDSKHPLSLCLLVNFLDSHQNVDVIYSDYYYYSNYPFKWDSNETFWKTELPIANLNNLLSYNSPHSSPIWRKSIHLDLGYFDESLISAADWEFWLRCAYNGKLFHKFPLALHAYYYNLEGISTKIDSPGESEQWGIRKKYQEKLLDYILIYDGLEE
jgi:hypothetical protein